MAQTPIVDTGFLNASPDDDIDLIIVRENFDPVTYRQSVYFRACDAVGDRDAIGGTITFSPSSLLRLED